MNLARKLWVYVPSFLTAQVLPGREMFLLALARLHCAELLIRTSQQVPIAVALGASMVLLHGKGISPKANVSPPRSARTRSSTQCLWQRTCMILAVSYVVLENGLCLFMCLCTEAFVFVPMQICCEVLSQMTE